MIPTCDDAILDAFMEESTQMTKEEEKQKQKMMTSHSDVHSSHDSKINAAVTTGKQ